jgi:hypothetical protein
MDRADGGNSWSGVLVASSSSPTSARSMPLSRSAMSAASNAMSVSAWSAPA